MLYQDKFPALCICLAVLTTSLFTKQADSAECMASGSSFREAAKNYALNCSLTRKDCDPINGRWYCSSESITERNSLQITASQQSSITSPPLPFVLTDRQAQDVTDCIDTDKDGWGWNGVESCKITRTIVSSNRLTDRLTLENLHIQDHVAEFSTQDITDCIDSDNDGWGWNGVESCKTTLATEASGTTASTNTESEAPGNCEKLNSGNYHITDLVTDVFLTAGQSNATGEKTLYEPYIQSKDKINDRVLVWTEKNQWEVANPSTQSWHSGKYPSGRNIIYNHPGFQIGRAIAELDECRVVAFIATAAAGKQIDYWRENQDGHFSYIADKVTNAINSLPVRHQVDMIWWMQGESDNDQLVNRYYYKLNDLITAFRSESWFPSDGYFLANETGWSPYANEAIRKLGNDNNVFTDHSRGEDSPDDRFPHITSETVKTHFNEIALRKIGDIVANKYVYEYLKARKNGN